jgi:hypothetical protein
MPRTEKLRAALRAKGKAPIAGLEPHKPWDPQPEEPAIWYSRFLKYLELGPNRSYQKCCNLVRGELGMQPYTVGGDWSIIARRWRWQDRAKAWDAEQHAIRTADERELRLEARRKRLEIEEEFIGIVRDAFATADIASVDQEQAREWLPQLRKFLCEMLVIQRQEFEGRYAGEAALQAPTITADDLRQAQRELERQLADEQAAAKRAEARRTRHRK